MGVVEHNLNAVPELEALRLERCKIARAGRPRLVGYLARCEMLVWFFIRPVEFKKFVIAFDRQGYVHLTSFPSVSLPRVEQNTSGSRRRRRA